jgi:hypothetical protein
MTITTEAPTAPAPISLPTRALFPARPLAAGLFLLGTASFALSGLRPKNVPPPLQLGADVVTATVVGLHPFEALVVRRVVTKRNVTPKVRRRAFASTLVYGVFGTVPALRAIRTAKKSG